MLLLIYLLLPALAGLGDLGEECGPKIYLRSHHNFLYGMAYDLSHDDTSRCGCVFYERPWFYGLPMHKKKPGEGQAVGNLLKRDDGTRRYEIMPEYAY